MSNFLLLAVDDSVRAVQLSFEFYLLNLLVPIIPAVVIYKLFPEGNTEVEGNLGGWKIKSAGAFAAYVTAFVLGCYAINSTAKPLIVHVGGATVWTVEPKFLLTDENGKELPSATVDKLEAEPPMVTPFGKTATIRLYSDNLEPPDELQVKLEGYVDTTVDLKAKDVKIDGHIIKPPVITLKRLPPPDASGPALTPLPAGVGPAALTSNP